MSIPSLLPTGPAPAAASASAPGAGSADDFHALMREHLDRTADRRAAEARTDRADRREARAERADRHDGRTASRTVAGDPRAARRTSAAERRDRDADSPSTPEASAHPDAALAAASGAAAPHGAAAVDPGPTPSAGQVAHAGGAAGAAACAGGVTDAGSAAGGAQAGTGVAPAGAAAGSGAPSTQAQATATVRPVAAGPTAGGSAGAGAGTGMAGRAGRPGTAVASPASRGSAPDGEATGAGQRARVATAGAPTDHAATPGTNAGDATTAASAAAAGQAAGAVPAGADTDAGNHDTKRDPRDSGVATTGVGPTVHAQPGSATATTSTAAASQPGGPSQAVLDQVLPVVPRLVMRGDGTQRLTLKLHPADLGEVHLTVTVKDGAVDVTLAAGREARDALRDGSAQLRSLLQLTGHTTGQVVIRDLPTSAPPGPTPQPGPDAQPGQTGQQGQSGQSGQQGFSGGDASPMSTGGGNGHGRQSPGRPTTSGTAVRPILGEPPPPRPGSRTGTSSLDVRI